MPSFRLFSAGSNAQGQLANGTQDDAHEFRESHPALGRDFRVVEIASGANHALLLLEPQLSLPRPDLPVSRLLWGCGDGSKGQLGRLLSAPASTEAALGDPRSTPSTVFSLLDLGLHELGLVDYSIHMVAASWETSFVILRPPASHKNQSDVLLSMGGNDFGDLGIGADIGGKGKGKTRDDKIHECSHLPHVVSFEHILSSERDLAGAARVRIEHLTAGPHHVILALSIQLLNGGYKNTIVGWGSSRHGQLGVLSNQQSRPLPSTRLRSIPVPSFTPTPVRILRDLPIAVRKIALGNQHSVVLDTSGSVTDLGSNRKGQLEGVGGRNGIDDIDCTWNGTYLLQRPFDGSPRWSILAAGSQEKGQLGRSHLEATGVHPVNFPFDTSAYNLREFACGSEHVLALLERPRDTPDLASSETETKIETEVWAWGWNEHGNLGLGHTQDVSIPTRVWPPAAADAGNRRFEGGRAVRVWAGCGTSWILVEDRL
ncbi:hypothetical protein BOTBODRAFT_135231 [Botryobasidium botryosum FD-172 SS1]|uniref:Uncharacterized protein n=1 Tax=Botryobasidium botryosum (strain FD-172 SS1) TaxID=930990 RepID=A0A067MKF7_BOTB1|nr:hypothetical protein BOTBODRAFT_135231 [Botryobasidium botryosum FD-172 SS1]